MRKNYAGIDYFRLVAAFMVIGIHTSPFSVWNKDVDYLFTYCLGRVAVPFFLMTTGYFVLAPYVLSDFQKKRNVYKYLVKNSILYLTATILYLPITWYAGNLPYNAWGYFKNIFFDGTFYHLWYFPAAIIGCILIINLTEKSVKASVIISVITYLIGVFGDSYYGLSENIPLLRQMYTGIFLISSYTRNGIMFSPIFLMLGVLISASGKRSSKKMCIIGLGVSTLCMILEGLVTYNRHLQRHNSMYFSLIPVMYFLFQILLTVHGKAPKWIRCVSTIIYVIHPAVIIFLRGIAKLLGQARILVENTVIQFLAASSLSWIFAIIIQFCMKRGKEYVSKSKGMD